MLELELPPLVLHRDGLRAYGDDDGRSCRDRLLGLGPAVVRRMLLDRGIACREGVGDLLVMGASVVDAERVERSEKGILRVGERHPVLRPPRPGQRRLHVAEVELEHLRVGRLVLGVVEEPLLLAVSLDERDPLGRPPGHPQVVERRLVHGEEAARRPVLGRHVPDGCAIGERQTREAAPEVLDELPDHPRGAEDLGHGQHEVGRGCALAEPAGEAEADHLRDQHRDRLAEHRRLGLDPTNAPAEDAEPVDHGRVRVRPDEGVRKRAPVA